MRGGIARWHLVLFGSALLPGCASLYFESAGPAPPVAPQYQLAEWPVREYWSGIVFNGEKIGFSHLALTPAAEAPGLFEIRSEAAFVLRFAGYEKRVNLKAWDLVRDDLDLVRFRYQYSIDGSDLVLAGERQTSALEVVVTRAGKAENQAVPVRGPVYPQSAIGLYPSLHGLAPGRAYRYSVYSGELQKIADVSQSIEGYERTRLFEGPAYKIETAMEGYRVQTWINDRTEPMLEIAMNGVLISGLEDERRAKGYLTAASLNKSEALVDFVLVRPEHPLYRPREITTMSIALAGADREVPSDEIQRCTRDSATTTCVVHPAGGPASAVPSRSVDSRYLASTLPVPATDPAIIAMARKIAGGAPEVREQIRRLVAWIVENVRSSPADAWSALDVLEKREAECQGHTYLYTAFARALGIPTRIVNGITYSEEREGFLFHAWAESVVEGRWVAVDPTFGNVPADATHVKLVEGETLAELLPLADWIGQLKVRVVSVERTGGSGLELDSGQRPR